MKGVAGTRFFSTILSWVIPSVIFAVIWMYVGAADGRRRRDGRIDGDRKSKAKVYMETDTKVTFAMSPVSMRPRMS